MQKKHNTGILAILIMLVLPGTHLKAQRFSLPDLETFISDTLHIQVPSDSIESDYTSSLQVSDSRSLDGSIIGIRQTKKYKYIPVDQYLALDQPLQKLFIEQFSQDSVSLEGKFDLSNLILWTDNSAVLQKGLCLSAYSTLHDTLGEPVSDWIWELRVKREKKEGDSLYLGRVLQELIKAQSTALVDQKFNTPFYPHLFRRQLMTWSEVILFKDGYGINVHFTLDFPPDQESKWTRGSPGLFYRRSDIHESIAIGGMDQQWFKRLSPGWITQVSGTYRFGFNNFQRGKFKHLEYQNLLYINLSGQASIEYRPVYHRGLFGGLGLYAGYSILPDVIPQEELGAFIRLGIILP